MFPKLIASIASAVQGPSIQKFVTKLTNRSVVAPIVYSLLFMVVFALLYGIIGYKNMFETTDENKDKNWENSIVASVMLQSNAMGTVTPINSLGRWLSMFQTFVGWLWYLAVAALLL